MHRPIVTVREGNIAVGFIVSFERSLKRLVSWDFGSA